MGSGAQISCHIAQPALADCHYHQIKSNSCGKKVDNPIKNPTSNWPGARLHSPRPSRIKMIRLLPALVLIFKVWLVADSIKRREACYWPWIIFFVPFGGVVYFSL